MAPNTEIAARETFAPVTIKGRVLTTEVMALFREKMAKLAAAERPAHLPPMVAFCYSPLFQGKREISQCRAYCGSVAP